MIKLIVSDLDGTLLTRFKSVSIGNQNALLEAQKRGIKVCIATGRGYDSTHQFVPLLKLDHYGGFMVLNNGQRLRDIEAQTETVNGLITVEDARTAFKFAQEHKLQMVLDGEAGLAFYSPEDLKIYRNIYIFLIKLLPHFRFALGRIHIFALFGFLKNQKVKIIEHEDDLIESYDKIGFTHFKHHLDQASDDLNHVFNGRLEMMRVSDNWLDVSPKGITKVVGIYQVMKKLGLTEDEVMCLGDSENDVTMLSSFHYSFAMGNADSKIKAIANYSTASNKEDGVAQAIHKFVLKDGQNERI